MVVKGIFQGMDLYVQNPMLDDGEGVLFCVTDIKINDVEYDDVINSSAFRIALSDLNIELGAQVLITLIHSSECRPRIINPEILKPLSTYQLIEMDLGYENMLSFTTNGESSKLPFYVQQYRWGRWVNVASVEGKGGPGKQNYSVKVYPHHGENKFRIYQNDHLHRTITSDEKTYEIAKDSVVVETKISKIKTQIKFSDITYYIIQNEYGEAISKGYDEQVDVADLPKGKYYLRYDNSWLEFTKK
jgi:hypothetical protein